MNKKNTFFFIFILATFFILAMLSGCSKKSSSETPSPQTPQTSSSSTQSSMCGDGTCDAMEAKLGKCPEDCESSASSTSPASQTTHTSTIFSSVSAGESFVTYVPSEGIGNIAVQITLPETARYNSGAPLLVYISTFFTPSPPVFDTSFTDITKLGFAHVTYLWPGKSDPSGVSSDGTYDYGGDDSLQALRDVIRFASGQIPDKDGHYISDWSTMTFDTDNVGLYAFSHPGIAATNVLALYGAQLSHVKYFVGRENPPSTALSAMDLGYWDGNTAVDNPVYTYSDDYSSAGLSIDYSSVRWDETDHVPYFDLNGNGQADVGIDFIHGTQTPTMYGKEFYSTDLTQALFDNGALTEATWPSDVATPEEASLLWDFREALPHYPKFSSTLPDLKVLLVFNQRDHVQTSSDKPNIHLAYDGFIDAGLWVRLNPDRTYVTSLDSSLSSFVPDNNANSEPSDWSTISDWAYQNKATATKLVPLAAVAEMADRVETDNWDDNLDFVLVEYDAGSIGG